jgi:hypothetical protein
MMEQNSLSIPPVEANGAVTPAIDSGTVGDGEISPAGALFAEERSVNRLRATS